MVLALVDRVARQHGEDLSIRDAEHILWAFTGYPSFWPDDSVSPVVNLTRQLHEFFVLSRLGLGRCSRCGAVERAPQPPRELWLCNRCDEVAP